MLYRNLGNTCFAACVVHALHAAAPLHDAVVAAFVALPAPGDGILEALVNSWREVANTRPASRRRPAASKYAWVAPLTLIDRLWKLDRFAPFRGGSAADPSELLEVGLLSELQARTAPAAAGDVTAACRALVRVREGEELITQQLPMLRLPLPRDRTCFYSRDPLPPPVSLQRLLADYFAGGRLLGAPDVLFLRLVVDPVDAGGLKARFVLERAAAGALGWACADLRPWCDAQDAVYDLVALIAHAGQRVAGGHAVAWLRTAPGEWMLADDEHTEPGAGLPDGSSIADTPLVLAYVRRPAGEVAPPPPPWQPVAAAPQPGPRGRGSGGRGSVDLVASDLDPVGSLYALYTHSLSGFAPDPARGVAAALFFQRIERAAHAPWSSFKLEGHVR